MKTCPICKLEYLDEIDVCAKCGSKLEKEQQRSIGPADYEEGY